MTRDDREVTDVPGEYDADSVESVTNDPLAALGIGEGLSGGLGGFDMNALLQQAQQMQQLQDAQRSLAESSVDGTAGGVTVTVSGVGELNAVTIAVGRFDGADPEDLTDLGDLIVAAYRDAKSRADALASQALGPMAQGLGGSGLGISGPG